MKTPMLVAATLLTLVASQALQAQPGFGTLYYEGDVVRTVVPPAAAPKEGLDPLYPIIGGVDGQLPVTAVAPGDRDYHGGKWAVHAVMWNADATPYLLTSEAMVLEAEQYGYVSIARMRDADFKCPVQP